jgi:hypothetical protein
LPSRRRYCLDSTAAFFFVYAISVLSALSCFCNSSICRSRRSIFSESDEGTAAAGPKAREQTPPTRAPPIKLGLVCKGTSDGTRGNYKFESCRVLNHKPSAVLFFAADTKRVLQNRHPIFRSPPRDLVCAWRSMPG